MKKSLSPAAHVWLSRLAGRAQGRDSRWVSAGHAIATSRVTVLVTNLVTARVTGPPPRHLTRKNV